MPRGLLLRQTCRRTRRARAVDQGPAEFRARCAAKPFPAGRACASIKWGG